MKTVFETTEPPTLSGHEQIYLVRASWKFGMGSVGLLFVVAGILGCWYFGTGHEFRNWQSAALLVTMCAGFPMLGLYVALWVFRGALVLSDAKIELRGIYLRRALQTDQVAGYRTLPQRNGPPVLVLVPRQGRNLKISMMFQLDANFHDWLRRLPDLDEKDAADSEEAILSDQELGATTDERRNALASSKRIQRFATIATFGLCAWAWLYPVPYRVVVSFLVLVPIIAILAALRSNGLYRLDEQRNDAHPNLAIPFIFPGLILALRAISDFELLSWQRLVLFALAIGLVLTLLAAIADPFTRKKPITIVALLFCMFMYGIGSSLEANALFDPHPATSFSPAVIGRSVTHGKRTEYYLQVEGWGPHTGTNRVQVHRSVYDAATIGNPICIELKAGALSIPWYIVETCN
jgi:hypothetical protein